MKGVLALLIAFKWVSSNSNTYIVLNVISDAAFYFLPFFLAVSSSRRFKLNEYIGLSLAGVLMYPTILNLKSPIYFLNFIKIPVVSYATSVIPVILGTWLMSYVYRFIDKVIPKSLRIIFTPLLTMAISIPVILAFIGPIGIYAGNYLALASNYLFGKAPLIAGLLVGGIYPLIVLTGMHYAFFPVLLQNLSTYGYDNGFFPVSLFSNIAQAGAVFAVGIRTRNKEYRNIAFSAGFSALTGITEPALYGVNIKLKKPLYASMISGGIVSSIALTLGVKYFGFVVPGLAALPVTINPDWTSRNFIIALLGVVGSFIIAFALTLILGFEDVEDMQLKSSPVNEKLNEKSHGKNEPFIVTSPLEGEVIPLSEVDDNTFSKETMGKGIAILPAGNKVYAPFDGQVIAVVNSGHAIGIKSAQGVEMLIHIGLDTVSLKEKCFNAFLKRGDSFKEGQVILEFDSEAIKRNNFSLVLPIIITNSTNYLDVLPINASNIVKPGEKLLAVVK